MLAAVSFRDAASLSCSNGHRTAVTKTGKQWNSRERGGTAWSQGKTRKVAWVTRPDHVSQLPSTAHVGVPLTIINASIQSAAPATYTVSNFLFHPAVPPYTGNSKKIPLHSEALLFFVGLGSGYDIWRARTLRWRGSMAIDFFFFIRRASQHHLE